MERKGEERKKKKNEILLENKENGKKKNEILLSMIQ